MLFDDGCKAELAAMFRCSVTGKEPIALALMAVAMVLQGHVGASDAGAVELTMVDVRW